MRKRMNAQGSIELIDEGERSMTVSGHATLPPPVPGEHQWGAIMIYAVTDEELMVGEGRFSWERIIGGPDIGCLACERPFEPALLGTRCPGGAMADL